jgi:hypothetical protein
MRAPIAKSGQSPDGLSTTLIALLFAAALFRLAITLGLPLWFRHDAIHEDGLHMRLATGLASWDWLGPQDQLTALQGPGYAIFLCLAGTSWLPLSAAHALFQIAALAVTAWALYRVTASHVLAVATFMTLVLAPVAFVPEMQRVLPSQIYWAQVLVVFALATVVLYAPPAERGAQVGLAAACGAMLGWSWLTASDGTWLVPGLIVLACGALLVNRHKRSALIACARSTGVAIGTSLAIVAIVMTANLIAHGEFAADAGAAPAPLSEQASAAPEPERRAFYARLEAVAKRGAFFMLPSLDAVKSTKVHADKEQLQRYLAFFNDPFVSAPGPAGQKITITGWFYDTASKRWPGFAAYRKDGSALPYTLQRFQSPDLQKYFSDMSLVQNRFDATFTCPDECSFAALGFNRPLATVAITRDRDMHHFNGTAKLYIDRASLDWRATAELSPLQTTAESARIVLVAIYGLVVPLILLAGAIGVIAAIDGAIGTRTLSPVLVIAVAAWTLAGTGIVTLAAGGQEDPGMPALAPAAYMALFAAFLTFGAMIVQARQLRRELPATAAAPRHAPA